MQFPVSFPIDANGCVQAWNPSLELREGFRADEIIGRHFSFLYAPEEIDAGQPELDLAQAQRTGRSEGTRQRVSRSGARFRANLVIEAHYAQGGKLLHLTVVSQAQSDTPAAGPLPRGLHLIETALHAAPNPIVITDARGIIEWVNPAFTESSGYTAAEAVGRTPKFLKSGLQPDRYYAEMWRTIGAGKNWQGEFVNRRKNGEAYIEETTIAPIVDEAGVAQHYVAIKLDVTERRKLEENRQRLAAIIESTPDLVGQTDAHGRITYLNAAGLRLLGIASLEAAHGRSITDFHPPESARVIFEEGIPTATKEGTWSGESELLSADGRRVPVSQVIIAERSRDGTVAQLSTIIRDITERRQAAAQLQQQTEIMDRAPLALVITDLEHRVSHCNQGAADLYGAAREKLVGQNIEDWLFPEARTREAARHATSPNGHWTGETTVTNRAGRQLHLEIHLSVIRDAQTLPQARLIVAVDISERTKLEAQFLRAQRLESLGMLAAGIAHDLNNVLAPILMGIPMLREGATKLETLKLLATLEKSAERGAGIVRQILGFAHGVGGEAHSLHVPHVVADICGIMRETFPKSIRVEENRARDLRPVVANSTQIHQVLMNLCVNARDAMPEGGVLRVNVDAVTLDETAARGLEGGRAGAWLTMKVEDTGTGMTPEVRARIWEPFFTTKSFDKGTGLGLVTVRAIVQKYGGFVTVDSEVGRGTAFTVYLPTVDAPPTADAFTGAVPRGAGELILVVDDEPAICDLLNDSLKGHGYRVQVARDGLDALELFVPRSGEFRLVITDVSMPNMDGVTLSGVLRRLRPDTKILAISGRDKASRAMARGLSTADAFLSKPFKPDALLKHVHALIHPAMGKR